MSARSLIARLGLAFGLAGAMTSAAQSVPLDKAPAAWVAYAKQSTAIITDLLNGDGPPAPRMRQGMIKLRPGTPSSAYPGWVGWRFLQ